MPDCGGLTATGSVEAVGTREAAEDKAAGGAAGEEPRRQIGLGAGAVSPWRQDIPWRGGTPCNRRARPVALQDGPRPRFIRSALQVCLTKRQVSGYDRATWIDVLLYFDGTE